MPRAVVAVFAFAAALCAVDALAQERASIVGVVQDSSGAVLPGVTVEASSAVLIERVRSGVTDGSGRYAIIDLRPGTYSVTFSLPGFKSYKRDGIVLEGAFAATVNASLSVGQVEETVLVTAASPVVDLQSTQNQSVINRQALDVLPAARTMQGGASLVPGVSFYSQGFTSNMSIHGSLREDQHIYFDGMNIGQNLTQNGQQANGVSVNELAQQELVYDAGSQSAEVAVGGVRMDSIPTLVEREASAERKGRR
jgi:Carboxypeptidase regulatory-like domain